MLDIKDLSFSYAGQEIIKTISFSVDENVCVAILGPSGCGKTTVLKLIAGLLMPCSGVLVNKFRREETGFVFQDFCLLPWRTVKENVALVLHDKKMSAVDKNQRIDHALVITGLDDFAEKYPYELSGGMQQRTGLARALAVQPSLLLMDEPFSNVDGQTRGLLVEEFREIASTVPMTIVMVTHNIDDVLDLADQVMLFSGQPASIMERLDIKGYLQDIGREALRQLIWEKLRSQVKYNDCVGTRHA
ncbi:MAG: ABC transporter ATP-binding protein [Candidatus Endonucleobacter sp. (ex Gigantidas childressi)]|nr:ABC transporter ATP-binding protein [Candidatus Endonucleobacter sp. (ex Gigantidas childressi)]